MAVRRLSYTEEQTYIHTDRHTSAARARSQQTLQQQRRHQCLHQLDFGNVKTIYTLARLLMLALTQEVFGYRVTGTKDLDSARNI